MLGTRLSGRPEILDLTRELRKTSKNALDPPLPFSPVILWNLHTLQASTSTLNVQWGSRDLKRHSRNCYVGSSGNCDSTFATMLSKKHRRKGRG